MNSNRYVVPENEDYEPGSDNTVSKLDHPLTAAIPVNSFHSAHASESWQSSTTRFAIVK